MKRKNLITPILFMLIMCGCIIDKYDSQKLTVNNKSTTIIYSVISKNDDMLNSSYYDEFKRNKSSIPTKKDSTFSFVFEEIKPNERVANHDTPRIWKNYFNSIEDKKLRLFIISKDSVNKHGWHKIFNAKIYNKKYLLGIEDLEKTGWEVVYP